jgi:hypothetical protein
MLVADPKREGCVILFNDDMNPVVITQLAHLRHTLDLTDVGVLSIARDLVQGLVSSDVAATVAHIHRVKARLSHAVSCHCVRAAARAVLRVVTSLLSDEVTIDW